MHIDVCVSRGLPGATHDSRNDGALQLARHAPAPAWAARRFFVAALLLAAISPSPAHAGSTTLEHVITYGQSVAAGYRAVPALTRVQPQNSLMFNSGVRSNFVDTDRAPLYASFVPLVEQDSDGGGETPTAGTLEMINDLKFDEDDQSFDRADVQYVGSTPAVGGQTLARLNFGTVPFLALSEDISYGARLAAELGQPYRVGAVTWTQGEADYGIGTTREAYLAGMRTLHAWIDVDAQVFANQDTSVPIIQTQVSSHVGAGSAYPTIALAQLELANSEPGFYLATPTYMMDFADALHLTAISSKWLGAYLGLVYKRVVVDHAAWSPLQPVSVSAHKRVITVKFHVPAPPLVLDTRQVINPGSYGFSILSRKGKLIPIASVTVSGPDSLTIATSRSIPAGSKLRYAFKGLASSGRLTGPRGNLRDSQGDTLVFEPTGLNKRMDNWCVIFERAIDPA